MCFGFTGSPSLKSKADALKYAIEFTATGEYPHRTPDIKKAKELYNFICENISLPAENVDTNLLYTQSILDKIALHANACLNDFFEYTKQDRCKCNPGTPKPSGEVIGEQDKEEAIPLPVSSSLSPVANLVRSVLNDISFKAISIDADCNGSKELYLLERNGEALRVTITHTITPIE